MKLLILNGPNINFMGIREVDIYGAISYKQINKMIKSFAFKNKVKVNIKQTNCEGKMIDIIQNAYFKHYNGIIINPGAYTHTSIALLDAIKSVSIETVEVHMSDVSKREDFRQISYIRKACAKTIIGGGINCYLEAIIYFCKK